MWQKGPREGWGLGEWLKGRMRGVVKMRKKNHLGFQQSRNRVFLTGPGLSLLSAGGGLWWGLTGWLIHEIERAWVSKWQWGGQLTNLLLVAQDSVCWMPECQLRTSGSRVTSFVGMCYIFGPIRYSSKSIRTQAESSRCLVKSTLFLAVPPIPSVILGQPLFWALSHHLWEKRISLMISKVSSIQ